VSEQQPVPEQKQRNGEVVLHVEDIHTFYGTIEALKGSRSRCARARS
jgi:hypothetical protein